MMDQQDGSIQELLGLYYIILALSKEGSSYALPDKLDQLFRKGEYTSLPNFDDDYSTEEKKIKYNSDNFLLIEDSRNFENEIASAFNLINSEKRKNDLQNVINQDLKFVSRSREDISKVILSSSSDVANRIVPAFKYNLLFDLELYNLPNHYDIWKETSSVSDLEGTFGLEFPILVNRINLGNKDFFSYSPESKINYSLGFDLINFINYGNNYFGLLGEYNYTGNQIRIQPINVSFSEGRLIQSLN